MSIIYTEPFFKGEIKEYGYKQYTRDVYCVCGKKIGTQTKYDKGNFVFDDREKANYKFCPYCGKVLKG